VNVIGFSTWYSYGSVSLGKLSVADTTVLTGDVVADGLGPLAKARPSGYTVFDSGVGAAGGFDEFRRHHGGVGGLGGGPRLLGLRAQRFARHQRLDLIGGKRQRRLPHGGDLHPRARFGGAVGWRDRMRIRGRLTPAQGGARMR
jgi:hypothetical protein